MQHKPMLILAPRMVRAKICPRCYNRPAGSSRLGPDVPRSCEAQCPLFIHLPKLVNLVNLRDPMLSSAEWTVRNYLCQECHAAPTSGDFCAEYLARTCPLSRYAGQVIEILERLRDSAHKNA